MEKERQRMEELRDEVRVKDEMRNMAIAEGMHPAQDFVSNPGGPPLAN